MENHAHSQMHPAGQETLGRGGLLGLPTRLAITALTLVFACCAALGLLVSYELNATSEAQAKDAAETTARALAGDMSEGQLASPAAIQPTLDQRLSAARGGAASVEGLAVAAFEDGKLQLDDAKTGTLTRLDELVRDAKPEQKDPIFRTLTVDGKEHLQVLVPLSVEEGGTPYGAILMQVDQSGLNAGIAGSRWNVVLGAFIGACLLGALLLLLLNRELFRPLVELRETMGRVRTGEKGVRSNWDRADDLGALAADFDRTVDALEAAERELARYVSHDPETGVLNAEAFRDRVGSELTRWRRGGLSVAVLEISVRDWDSLGQAHGVQAQTRALRSLADAVGATIRPTDVAGRIDSGIAVAIVGAEADHLAGIVQRLRSSVAGAVTSGAGDGRVALGWSLSLPAATEDEESLLRRSHQATQRALQSSAERCAYASADGQESWLDERPSTGDAEELEQSATTAAYDLASQLVRYRGEEARYQRIADRAVSLTRELGSNERKQQQVRAAVGLLPLAEVDEDLVRSVAMGEIADLALASIKTSVDTPEARAIRAALAWDAEKSGQDRAA